MSITIEYIRYIVIIITICFMLHTLANSQIDDDKIINLPGQPRVNFHQHAGYIHVQHDRFFYYYFVESESKEAPLVLWLNGGPGCSSVGAGAFVEHGPFKVSGDHLIINDYSWNKEANMLYLESPAGVGFSYSTNKSYYDYVDDDMTARDNIIFLEQWLNKFQKYRNSDFYIAGESYGGHYGPQLAMYIMKSKMKINLKGIALGNPLLDLTDFNARAVYLWSHGLISDGTFKLLNTVCNFSEIRRQYVHQGFIGPICYQVAHQCAVDVGKLINFYDVTADVCSSVIGSQSAALHKFGRPQPQDSPKIDVCLDEETYVYLNREDVREALHARLVNVKQWSVFSSVLHYNMQNLELSMSRILGSLVRSGVRVLAYSGDQDSVLPLTATRTAINKLAEDLRLNETKPYGNWLVGHQVAGYIQVYGNILAFATVRGASHEAPYSQPERSFALFKSFLRDKM